MGLLTLFCVITVAFTGLTSGAGVLPEDSVNRTVGGSVTFTTSLTPTETPLYFISWNKGTSTNILTSVAGDIVSIDPEYEGRVSLNVLTGSLELRNLALSDTGEYGVIIRPTAGDATIPGEATLNVYEPVSNVRITTNNTDLVEFNDTVRLSCSASGSPLSFLWFNGSVEVTASERVRITDRGATLTIVTVLRYDQGSYTCKASNPVSSSTSIGKHLYVSYGPEGVNLTISPSEDLFWEGSVVSFSCSADSRPVAQFRWFINGEMLSSTGAQINLVMEPSGNYSCQAFNSKTLRYTSSQPEEISVLNKIRNPSVKSSNPPVEGGSVNLTCDASGSIPIREWMINGVELKPSENIVFNEEKKVLLFRVLTRKDNGRYTCNISNPFSSDSAFYEMIANYGPAPDSVQISGLTDVPEGSTLKLSCSAESVPTAKYTWTKNGTTLGQSHEYTKENIQLSDSGEYICRATNDITLKYLEASHTVNVTAKIPSDNPCPTGCIVGSVFGCCAGILLICGGVFYAHRTISREQKPKSNTRTDGEGRDNSAFAQNQEVNYADVRFMKKGGAVVQLGAQNGSQDNTEYSEVRKNTNPPVSRLPTYDAHMQQGRRPAPEPPTEYARVRPR